MKKWLHYGTQFMKQSDWKDLALIKCCLCAVGFMWGVALPKKKSKVVIFVAATVFIATYIPLMLKLLNLVAPQSTRRFHDIPLLEKLQN